MYFDMVDKRRLILISNDDGYFSKGMNSLIDMLSGLGDLLVCAPDSARSGFSCAYTATMPLKLELRRQEQGLQVWSCSGTPADCVKLALEQLCGERRPDLVIGGINHGDNSGVNAHYSGTMGIVLEGCMKYIPSIAYSLCDMSEDADFSPLRSYIMRITRRVLDEGLPMGVCLNVNFPLAKSFKGVRICRMSHGTWSNESVKMRHPRGQEFYWMTGEYTNDEPDATDTDNYALANGYVAITPTTIDMTDYGMIERMNREWDFGNS